MFRAFLRGIFHRVSIATSATLFLLSPLAARATTIAYAGFEETGDTWLGASISGTGGAFSSTAGSTDTPASQRILEGLRSFQTNNGSAILDFAEVDVSNFDSITLTIRVSSTPATTGNGNDGPDFVRLFTALNGAPFAATADISLNGNGNARWGFDATLAASTTAGTYIILQAPQVGTSTNNYSTLTINIPDSASSVDFRLMTFNDNSGEFWNIDSVVLTGTLVPEPSSFATIVGGLGMLCSFQRLRASSRRRTRVS